MEVPQKLKTKLPYDPILFNFNYYLELKQSQVVNSYHIGPIFLEMG